MKRMPTTVAVDDERNKFQSNWLLESTVVGCALQVCWLLASSGIRYSFLLLKRGYAKKGKADGKTYTGNSCRWVVAYLFLYTGIDTIYGARRENQGLEL